MVVEGLQVDTSAGATIIDEVSFEIFAGEVLALVGESGCGKTTLGMALLGHARTGTRITRGSVWFESRDLLKLPESGLRRLRGARVAYVPQDATAGLNPRHRVGEQLAESLFVHGVRRDEAEVTARELLEHVGLPADREFARRYPFQLSGGQQQRIAIAMALACKPAVVVLDEPTTGLDVTTQARILKLLRRLSRESSAAFVYVTHDLAVVDGLADRVCVMYAGRIVEEGIRPAVFRRPAHPYTSMLLASVPRLSHSVHLSGIAGTAPPPGLRPRGCFFEPRCPLAIDVCKETFPPRDPAGRHHSVRCWRATESSSRLHIEPAEAVRAVPSNALLLVDGVSASYGRGSRRQPVLREISLSIASGECLALVGESGSGKTTLGRCVVGLHTPDNGEILMRGTHLEPSVTQRSRADRRAIQLVFQNPDRSLNPRETVSQAIGRPLRLFQIVERAGEHGEIMRLLERVRLPRTVENRYPPELSGGEKQRVAIARALAGRPELLICDEITSSLDVSIQAAIVSLLDELQREGLAMLFITHNLALVNSLAHRVLVLERGEMREYGSTKSVIGAPTDAYTRQLIASVPSLSLSAQEEGVES